MTYFCMSLITIPLAYISALLLPYLSLGRLAYLVLDIFSIGLLQISQRDILNSIDRETSGNFKKGLAAIGEYW